MTRAYECFSEERNEVVGVSWWDSVEARERYRLSPVEAERQRAMAPYVEAESSGLYVGRELEIPKSP
jgi:heme-degrading monooxygenase HmoA